MFDLFFQTSLDFTSSLHQKLVENSPKFLAETDPFMLSLYMLYRCAQLLIFGFQLHICFVIGVLVLQRRLAA